jgi:integrase/recombinase XerD
MWKAAAVKHRGEKRIAIYFDYNPALMPRIKKLEGVKWSNTMKAWHVPDNDENRKRFKIEAEKCLTEIHLKKMANFKRWMEAKRYSENTIKTYSEVLGTFLLYYHDRPVEELNNIDINNFNNDYIIRNNLSGSYQNQFVNAAKLFFKVIEASKIDVELIYRPRRAKTLPNVLSKEEVKLILDATKNLKHKTMLSLIYACGLRSGELLNLLPDHVDSNRGVLIIKQAKGNKDRIAPLGSKLIEMLRFYFVTFKPKHYLFEGQQAGSAYDARSLQQVIKQSLGRTNITKNVTLHWLRHSYATHLLENGTDLRYIQEILGHRSSRTTEIYTHVSTKSIQKIVSPFDSL